jgi:PAS domain S-box-containing protein
MLKIFEIVNSPFYSLPNRIDNLSQAIGLLGIRHVANLALTIFIVDILKKFYKDDDIVVKKWKSIITSANAAKILSKKDFLFLSALIFRIPEFIHALLVSEGYEKDIDFNNELYKKCLLLLSTKWNLSDEIVNSIEAFYTLKTKGEIKDKDAVFLYSSEIISDFLLLNGTKEGLLEKIGKLLKLSDKEFFDNIKKIEENTNVIFKLFLNNENVNYTNILSLFSNANSKIFKLLNENNMLLKEYESANNILKTAFNNTPLGVILLENNNVAVCNDEAVNLIGKQPVSIDDILDEKLQTTLEKQNNKNIRMITSLKNGVTVELAYVKLVNESERILLFIKDLRDELKLKKRYKRVKDNYIYLLNSVGVGICITSLKGVILFANEKFFQIFKREEKEFIRNNIAKFFPFTKNLQNIFDKLLKKEVKEINTEVKSFDAKHNLIYLEVKLSLYKELEKIVGFQFIINDITNKKELELENKQLYENKIAMEVAGTTAHEINQPLTTLILSIDLLKNSKNPQVIDKCIDRINISANRIEHIVKKLSEITRYETRTYAKRPTILDLNSDNENNK